MFQKWITLDPNSDGTNQRMKKTNHEISIVKDYYGIRHEDIRGSPQKKIVGTNSKGEEIKKSVRAQYRNAFYYTIKNWEKFPLDISQYQVVNRAFWKTQSGIPRVDYWFRNINGALVDNYAIISAFVEEEFGESDFLVDREDVFQRNGRELPLEELDQIIEFRSRINADTNVEERNNIIKKIREEFKSKRKNDADASNNTRRSEKAEKSDG